MTKCIKIKHGPTATKINKQPATSYLQDLAKDQSSVEDYVRYWTKTIPVVSDNDYFMRWMFAFLSVRTSWRANCIAYSAVEKLINDTGGYLPAIDGQKDYLFDCLRNNRIGLEERRHDGMARFNACFRVNKADWYKKVGESLKTTRDRLSKQTYGLGLAKTSFVLEMAYPSSCEVICLDTHMLQLYGLNGNSSVSNKVYNELEDHWCNTCRALNLPAPIARHIYWDRKQNIPQKSTRYWSYVFEKRRPLTSPYNRNRLIRTMK